VLVQPGPILVSLPPESRCDDARPTATIHPVTDRARKLLEEAQTLSVEERTDLAAKLLASLPSDAAEELHPEWTAEIERRARAAWADPEGGEPWDVVEQRLLARFQG